jgi:hypothetical protein
MPEELKFDLFEKNVDKDPELSHSDIDSTS